MSRPSLPVLLEQRARILRAVRDFFHQRDFLEVETPCRVVCPGLEPHLEAFPAGDGKYLATSPELHLKRLIAAGAGRIFEIAHAFRDDEGGPWHRSEFLMLEWYRSGAGLDTLMDDVEDLVRTVAAAVGRLDRPARGCDLRRRAERLTVREAFGRWASLDLADLRRRDDLAAAARQRAVAVDPADGWDEIFFKVLIQLVEPHLGRERMTILSAYPASQAALARVRDDPRWPVAERFELYAGGLELANAFDELTDADEQRRRHLADQQARRRLGRDVPPLDEPFLAALASGMPPTAGIALGLERLMALVLGAESIHQVMPFPEE
ncbi:MAG: EF-P lysine aminoacylase EpmA [Acidobacteriota bacterium]|nr:EF-P lysine aminoacylase EpmA [Acidobacteriota bacterium]